MGKSPTLHLFSSVVVVRMLAASGDDGDLDNARRHLLYSARDSTDKSLRSCLMNLAQSTGQISGRSQRAKRGWKLETAFNDPELCGGGVKQLFNDLVICQPFCPNESKKHGLEVCGRIVPQDHTGPCQHCGTEVYIEDAGGSKCWLNVDYYFSMEKYYNILFQSTDIAQRLVDYYPTTIRSLSVPLDDLCHRVTDIQSGYVARYDYSRHPERFTMDITPKVGEDAMLDLGAAFDDELVEAKIIEEQELFFVVRRKGSETLERVKKSDVHKVNGTMQLNVFVAEDSANVYEELQYSNMARTEFFLNVSDSHRLREEFNPVLGISAGGEKHFNVHERSAYYEKQRRALEKGMRLENPFTVVYNGRKVTVHSCTLHRNEVGSVLDNVEAESLGGRMGHRSKGSLSGVLENFEALSLTHRCVYSFLLNQEVAVRTRQSSDIGFKRAEEVRGTPEWDIISRETGCKFMTLQWKGSTRHGLSMQSDRSTYLRIEHEKYHAAGIVSNIFREFLLSLTTPKRRAVLAVQPRAIRQPPGARIMHLY